MRTTDFELQKKANQFRIDHGLGPQEPVNIRNLFFKLGIVAVFKQMSDDFSGMSIKVNDDNFILINSNHPVGRQNFTICHEFYHLFIQDNFQSNTCITGEFNKKNKSEYEADRFAAFFLMPEDGILNLIPENELKKKNLISLSTCLRIEQYFSCSRSALLFRLGNLNMIDLDKYEFYRSDIVREAIKQGYDKTLYMPGNSDLVIGNYGELAKKLFDQEDISESHYAILMRDIGIDVDEDI